MTVKIKRVYEEPLASDGQRILVDRLWPRGLSKDKAHVDLWLKDIAPSTGLRTWFGHDPTKWSEFQKRYRAELQTNPAVVELRTAITKAPTTLVYGAKDEQHNDAVVLQAFLGE